MNIFTFGVTILALTQRAGIRCDGGGVWIRPDGRRTSAIVEALIWALVAIAEED